MAGSRLIGRDRELDALSALVEKSPLVTLTGPPGVGKSRLAIELGRSLSDQYRDGFSWVDFGTVREPALVPEVLATALGSAMAPAGGLTQLLEEVAQRQLLVLFDNCERVLDACRDLVGAILATCPEVCVLATSQERLGIVSERVWHVPPLEVPAHWQGGDLSALRQSAAVVLFCERAAEVSSGFTITQGNGGAVVAICRRLDGIPLALELAAARTQVMTPDDIAAGLDDRFALLTGSDARPVGHHGSLRAAFDWSYDLLAEPEASLLMLLSVFCGGASLEAVEALAGSHESSSGLSGENLLDLLTRLVAKSWVVADTAGQEARYRLLETVRHYAAERLAAKGGMPATKRRHAQWLMGMADKAETGVIGPERAKWLGRLEAERDNVAAVIDWAIAENEADVALRMGAALAEFWCNRGSVQQGRQWLDAAIDMDAGQPLDLRAKARRAAASLALTTGDKEAAARRLHQALGISRDAGDDAGAAHALAGIGLMAMMKRDPEAARSLLHEALALARSSRDSGALVVVLTACGRFHLVRREAELAQPCFEECFKIASEAGLTQRAGEAAGAIGGALAVQGDYRKAEEVFTRFCEAQEDHGLTPAFTRIACAEVARLRGNYAKAKAMAEKALAAGRDLGAPVLVSASLGALGRLALSQGNYREARALFEEALLHGQGGLRRPVNPAGLLGLGEARLASGELDGAREQFEKALALATEAGNQTGIGSALHGLGEVARADGREEAAALHDQALVMQMQGRDPAGIADSLEAVARLAAASRRHDRAVRLLAAAQALRDDPRVGYARFPSRQEAHEALLADLREAMGDADFDAAWAEGLAMSAAEASAYGGRGRGGHRRGVSGWESLSRTEREVAALVPERLTNAELGERLFISPRTVQTHLSHIFKKLEISSKAELAAEVSRRREAGEPIRGTARAQKRE